MTVPPTAPATSASLAATNSTSSLPWPRGPARWQGSAPAYLSSLSPSRPTARDIFKRPCCSGSSSNSERVSLLWEERFEPRYGPWRGFYDQEVARYLDCLSSQGTASSSAASPVFTVTPVATTSSQAGMLFPIHNRARPYPRELPSATGFTPTSLQVAPAQLDEGP